MAQHDPLAAERVAPVPVSFTRKFWEEAKAGRLMLQYCKKTGKPQFYPRPVSVFTGRRDVELRPASGRGKVYTHTVTYRAAPPYKTKEPYVVAMVELEEGVRIMANIINCDPKTVRIDMPVRLVWAKAGDSVFPAFEPA